MTRNPYAHPMDLPEPEGPQGVSALAVTSLVLGLLCCIPGVGLLATILGGAALVRISGSGGRLGGRGMALAGLVLGLLGTVIWIALTVGLMSTLSGLKVYGDTIGAIERRDHAAVRAMLTPAATSAVTDERLDEFADQLAAEWGSYQRMPKGLGDWVSGYIHVGPQIEPALNQVPAAKERKFPIPLIFDGGQTVGIFVIDPDAPTGNAAKLDDIVVLDKSGKPMFLIGGTPARPAPPSRPAPTGQASPTPSTPPAPTGQPAGAPGGPSGG